MSISLYSPMMRRSLSLLHTEKQLISFFMHTFFCTCVYYRPFLNEKQLNFDILRGKGACLIDFGCSIDTQVFPEETMFVGSSETDAFQCPAMTEGRPWKWQVKPIVHSVYYL